MSGNPFYSGRIPPKLLEHIENYRQKSGESKTEILIRALSAYTGFALPKLEIELDNPLLNRIESLEKTVKTLNGLIGKHEEAIIQLRKQEEPKNDKLPLFRGDNKINIESDNKSKIKEGTYSHKEVEGLLKGILSPRTLSRRHSERKSIEEKGMIWTPIDQKGKRDWNVVIATG